MDIKVENGYYVIFGIKTNVPYNKEDIPVKEITFYFINEGDNEHAFRVIEEVDKEQYQSGFLHDLPKLFFKYVLINHSDFISSRFYNSLFNCRYDDLILELEDKLHKGLDWYFGKTSNLYRPTVDYKTYLDKLKKILSRKSYANFINNCIVYKNFIPYLSVDDLLLLPKNKFPKNIPITINNKDEVEKLIKYLGKDFILDRLGYDKNVADWYKDYYLSKKDSVGYFTLKGNKHDKNLPVKYFYSDKFSINNKDDLNTILKVSAISIVVIITFKLRRETLTNKDCKDLLIDYFVNNSSKILNTDLIELLMTCLDKEEFRKVLNVYELQNMSLICKIYDFLKDITILNRVVGKNLRFYGRPKLNMYIKFVKE